MTAQALSELARCRLCPRLVANHQSVRDRHSDYHAAPVGAWGPRNARVLLVGLAPGLHGATRTGRAFVGDASGAFLFSALYRAGFASSDDPARARLHNLRITNVVKCLPPGNAPSAQEVHNCRQHLLGELDVFTIPRMRKSRVIVALGGLAHRALCSTLGVKGAAFGHGAQVQVHAKLSLVSSFHPSRLNVNTRRLTGSMMDEIFQQVHKLL